MTARPVRGFTMVEIVIVMLIVAVLTALATPMVKNWIQNSAIRTTADSLQNALRAAQSEAIRRSQQVTFVLSASPGTYNGTPATTGSYWYVQAIPVNPNDVANATTEFVQASPQGFASNGISISSAASAVCFNSLGRQVTNTNVTSFPNIPATCTAANTQYTVSGAAGTRTLWVQLSLGGKVRMCDPNKTFSSTNPDGC